ncbi:hypothetical protein ACJW30_04G104400 [Castanea mollissima]
MGEVDTKPIEPVQVALSLEAETRINEFESKVKEMGDQLVETAKIREQLSHVLSELKATQSELLSMETELAVARDSNLKAMTRAELIETASNMAKEKTEELLKSISDLSEDITKSKLAAIEAEKEKLAVLSEKDAEIELARAAALMAKSVIIDALQLEIKQSSELLRSSDKSATDIINSLNQLQVDLEVKERRNLDQSIYIETLEIQLNRLKLDYNNSEEESKIAAAEERAKSVKSGLYLAVQQLAVEAHEAKEENLRLKQGADEAAEETENSELVGSQSENPLRDVEASQTEELKINESLIKKSEKADHFHESLGEDSSQKNWKLKPRKIGEFRNRAEQAVSRAELAEKAKVAIEEQLRKWREQKQRRRAALAALREESARREFDPQYDKPPPTTTYPPLGKVLNMKF